MTKLTKDQAITYLQALFFDLDESDIKAVELTKTGGHVLFSNERFFKEFGDYGVRKHVDPYFQYELNKTMYGIRFISFLTSDDVEALKKSNPSQYIYIDKSLQEVEV